MNGLDHITIKGFKSIASIENLRLRPINVVIGANGSGKSNFLEAFAFLREIAEGGLRNYTARAGGSDRLLHFGSKVTEQISLGFRLSRAATHGVHGYDLRLRPTDDDWLFPASETLAPPGERPLIVGGHQGAQEASISGTAFDDRSRPLREYLAGWRRYHWSDTGSSSPIRKTAKVDDNRALRADGSNLAPFLYLLRARWEDSFQSIVKEVRRVAPFFQDFLLEPLELQPSDIKLEWKHRNADRYFDASSLSDGTLRFIALATLFLQPNLDRHPLLLVDEPELGLHPYALEILALLVRQASKSTQIILSTQSPTLLNYFEPKDVLVAELINDATTLRRLEAEPLKEWLEDYSLGQLWEKNEFGGRPVPA